jgi:hypothetical protein
VGGFVRLLTVNDRKSSWVLSVGNSSWKIQSVQANLTDGRSAEYFTYCDKEELQLADKASYAFMANNRGGVFSRNRFGRLLRLNYERPNRMKIVLVAIALAGLLLLFSRNANAQIYDLYYYWDGSQYQQYSPQYDLLLVWQSEPISGTAMRSVLPAARPTLSAVFTAVSVVFLRTLLLWLGRCRSKATCPISYSA